MIAAMLSRMTLSKAQVLAFLQPIIATASGVAAAWLLVHVHVLGIFHASQSQVAALIAGGTVFVVTTVLTWLSTHQHLVPIVDAAKFGSPPVPPVPISSVIGWLTPYISIAVGAGVAWLFVHIHILGIFHLDQGHVTQVVASAIVFALVSVLTWAAHTFNWLPIRTALHAPVVPAPVPAGRPKGRVG